MMVVFCCLSTSCKVDLPLVQIPGGQRNQSLKNFLIYSVGSTQFRGVERELNKRCEVAVSGV